MTEPLNVLVTGGSSGIGRATAVDLAKRGHRVFAAARRLSLLEELASEQDNIVPVQLDVTDADSVAAAVRAVDEHTDGHGVDVLVNSAGYAILGPVELVSDEDTRRQFEINVFGALAVTRAVLPSMRARRSGRVINISSMVGRLTTPGNGVYSASKFALEALSDALRREVSDLGVTVVLIEPGFVTTNIYDGSRRELKFPITSPPEDYAPLVAASGKYILKAFAELAIPAEDVAHQVAEAVAAEKPEARYLFPEATRQVVNGIGSLPDLDADRILRQVIGLTDAAPVTQEV